jgi:hypothetical protein
VEEEGTFGSKIEIDADHPIDAIFDVGTTHATSAWIISFLQKNQFSFWITKRLGLATIAMEVKTTMASPGLARISRRGLDQ